MSYPKASALPPPPLPPGGGAAKTLPPTPLPKPGAAPAKPPLPAAKPAVPPTTTTTTSTTTPPTTAATAPSTTAAAGSTLPPPAASSGSRGSIIGANSAAAGAPAITRAPSASIIKPIDDELHSQACRVYSLVSKKWVELGEGNVTFRKKTLNFAGAPAPGGAPAAGSYSSIRMAMNETKSGAVLINHTVHPKIELKPNGDRSWTWTIVQKVAEVTDAPATATQPEVKEGKQTLTYAFKFKTNELAVVFKTKFDEYRHLNQDEEVKKPPKPGRPTIVGRPEGLSVSTKPTATAAATDSPQPNAPPPAATPPAATPKPATAPVSTTPAATTAPTMKASEKEKEREASNAASAAAAASVASSLPKDPNRPSVALPKKQSRMLHAHTDFGTAASSASAAAAASGTVLKRLDLFNESMMTQLTESQKSAITQTRARLTKNFPIRKTVRYVRRKTDAAIAVTESSSKDLAQLEARLKVLTTLRQLLATDKSVMNSIVHELQTENAALRDLAALHSKSEKEREAASTSATAGAIPVGQLLKSLHVIAKVNKSGHKQSATAKLTVEGMMRDKQFGALVQKSNAEELEKQRAKDEKHARLIRALGSRAKAPSVSAPGPSALAALSGSASSSSLTLAAGAASAAVVFPVSRHTKAEIVRFKIVKFNRFNRNTPRLLELDITTKSLTICKKKANDENGFSNRDIILTNETLVSAELPTSTRDTLSMTICYWTAKKSNKINSPTVKVQKTWKIIFDSTGERERFFRLLQINLINTRPRSSSAQSKQTYTPRPLNISRVVESAVRQLPVTRLATELHSTWYTTRQQQGWKYAKVTDDAKQTHNLLVPFKQLPAADRDQLIRIVTQTLASILTLGFVCNKSGDDDVANSKKGTISKDLLTLTEFLSENTHDTWASYRFANGWTCGAVKDRSAKTHPQLKPYNDLPYETKERPRNSAFKIMGTLIEWGYTITKKEDALLEALAGKEADRRITALRTASKSTLVSAAAMSAVALAAASAGAGATGASDTAASTTAASKK